MADSPTAVVLYEGFCMFEISVALSELHRGGKAFLTCSTDGQPLYSEEGVRVVPDCAIDAANPAHCSSLLLPGAADIGSAVCDQRVLRFIRQFQGKPIGAISIAPILLVRAGIMGERRWMAGVNRWELAEEGFSPEELAHMVDWETLQAAPIPEGYLLDCGLLTSVAYHFVPFGVKFAEMMGVHGSVKDYAAFLR